MAKTYDNVIVFGPTGSVGSVVALEASKRGAKVWLAMRDPNKDIPGLSKDQHSSNTFERIKADLADPESVKEAVQKSGAKAAYIYQVQAPKGMKPTVEALKEGGIEYVVFLSSFTLRPGDDLRKIQQADIIPWVHAQVEIALEDVGLEATLLRPGSFAYNTFWQNLDTTEEPWTATLPESERRMDGIVPLDMGRVGGAVLVERPSNDLKHIIYLYGPQLQTAREQLADMKRITGKKVDIKVVGTDEYRRFLSDKGFPKVVLDYFIKNIARGVDDWAGKGHVEEGMRNIKKYSGYESTNFEEYVKVRFG